MYHISYVAAMKVEEIISVSDDGYVNLLYYSNQVTIFMHPIIAFTIATNLLSLHPITSVFAQ